MSTTGKLPRNREHMQASRSPIRPSRESVGGLHHFDTTETPALYPRADLPGLKAVPRPRQVRRAQSSRSLLLHCSRRLADQAQRLAKACLTKRCMTHVVQRGAVQEHLAHLQIRPSRESVGDLRHFAVRRASGHGAVQEHLAHLCPDGQL